MKTNSINLYTTTVKSTNTKQKANVNFNITPSFSGLSVQSTAVQAFNYNAKRSSELKELFTKEISKDNSSKNYNDIALLDIIRDKDFNPNEKIKTGTSIPLSVADSIIETTNSLILFRELVRRPDFNPNLNSTEKKGFLANLIQKGNSKFLNCLLENNSHVDLNMKSCQINPNGLDAITFSKKLRRDDFAKMFEDYKNCGWAKASRNMQYALNTEQPYFIK